MSPTETLCVGLRFRPDPDPAAWRRTFDALVAWDGALAPTNVHRRDDPEASPDEPWSDALWPQLARRAARDRWWSWGLERREGAGTSIDVGRGELEHEVDVALNRPAAGDVAARVGDLLAEIRDRGGVAPALALVYDCDGPDAELAMQGLRGLSEVPPLLYLDARAVERAGGRHRVVGAPARVIEVPGGGLILVTRDPWAPPSGQAAAAVRAARAWLGIGDDEPLVLL